MPNNGVVLVVTSAGSHQLELEKSIKEKSSKKNVKIYFTFSPFCREACGDSLPVYKRLSDNRMFNLSDFSSKSFLETVVYTVWKKSFRFTHLHMWRSPINRSFYAQNQNVASDMLQMFLGFKVQDIMKTNAWIQRNTKKDVVSHKSHKAVTENILQLFFAEKGGTPLPPLTEKIRWVGSHRERVQIIKIEI